MRGALNGSRLFEQPQYAAEVAAWRAALSHERVLVEVGFDHGRRLLNTARLNPGWQVVGLEVRRARAEQAAQRAAERGLGNVLPWRADARTVLATLTPPASLDVVEALFPTPWWDPAKRDRRLLITPDFLADVAAALKPGGLLLVATDVADYAAAVTAALDGTPELLVDAEGWSRRPACTAQSRREWKCAREGLAVVRFAARRR